MNLCVHWCAEEVVNNESQQINQQEGLTMARAGKHWRAPANRVSRAPLPVNARCPHIKKCPAS